MAMIETDNYRLLRRYAYIYYSALDGSIQAGQLVLEIEEYLMTLPLHLRRFAFLKYFCCLPFAEIARRLNISTRLLYYFDQQLRGL